MFGMTKMQVRVAKWSTCRGRQQRDMALVSVALHLGRWHAHTDPDEGEARSLGLLRPMVGGERLETEFLRIRQH
jgi:hypothetical protein